MPRYPLHDAIKKAINTNNTSEIQSLLLQPGIDPNQRNAEGNTPLHFTISEPWSPTPWPVVDQGKDIDKIMSTQSVLLKWLLKDPRVNLYAENSYQETPFDIAIFNIILYFYDMVTRLELISFRFPDLLHEEHKNEKQKMESAEKAIMNPMCLLIFYMRHHSPLNEISLSEKYYSTDKAKQEFCIENIFKTFYRKASNAFKEKLMEHKDVHIQTIKGAYTTLLPGVMQLPALSYTPLENLAHKHKFFRGAELNNIHYEKAEQWVKFNNDQKIILAMLGNKKLYEGSDFAKLPQEIIDHIRFIFVADILGPHTSVADDLPLISRHSFNHLSVRYNRM